MSAKKPRAKPGPKPAQIKRKCNIPGCDRDHYALDMCFTHWRAEKGYGPGGDRQAANASYDSSEEGKARHRRAYKKRQIIKKLTGKTSITEAFSDPGAVATLRSSREDLEPIWHLFTAEQKLVLSGDQ